MDDESRIGVEEAPPPPPLRVAVWLARHMKTAAILRRRVSVIVVHQQLNVDAHVIGWLLDADVDMTVSSTCTEAQPRRS